MHVNFQYIYNPISKDMVTLSFPDAHAVATIANVVMIIIIPWDHCMAGQLARQG